MLFITKTIHIYLITPIGEKIVVFDPWKLPKQTYQEMTVALIGSIFKIYPNVMFQRPLDCISLSTNENTPFYQCLCKPFLEWTFLIYIKSAMLVLTLCSLPL